MVWKKSEDLKYSWIFWVELETREKFEADGRVQMKTFEFKLGFASNFVMKCVRALRASVDIPNKAVFTTENSNIA
jgi:hypothetical protein